MSRKTETPETLLQMYRDFRTITHSVNAYEHSRNLFMKRYLIARRIAAAQADIAKRKNAGPVVVAVSEHAVNHKTSDGHQVVICPEQLAHAGEIKKTVRCGYECKLCAMPERTSIIGFRAHGSQKRKVETLIQIAPVSR